MQAADTVDMEGARLREVVVRTASRRKLRTAANTELITSAELKRAACCNLGESFTTNPSVDVSYTDAATGARQIRLLGLSGAYVQMLSENIPAFRGAASPYGTSYMPGPWMQSIQVSKGASSVKNGYESVTGQINVEMHKPQAAEKFWLNGYADHLGKAEANAGGNLHFGDRWSAAIMLHGEKAFGSHDENGDGFLDMPAVRQGSALGRCAYMGIDYVMQASVKYLDERRRSGQDSHHAHDTSYPLYRIAVDTRRVEAFTKNAWIFDHDNDGNVAAIVSGVFHDQKAAYGMRSYDVIQKELYAQAMFERKWDEVHALSAGLTFSYDNFREHLQALLIPAAPPQAQSSRESVLGGYGQYTLNLDSRFIAMAGMRFDRSSLYGSFLTPRLHLRWIPSDVFTANVSAGRGLLSPHAMARYSYMLASSRRLVMASDIRQEKGWNTGGSLTWSPRIAGRKASLSAEYYYTRFTDCLTLDLDTDPRGAILSTLGTGARSHTLQLELTADITETLNATAAWRMTRVREDYGDGQWREKPLQPGYKWLLTAAWTPMMGLWQIDATFSFNGGGRMPDPGQSALWKKRFGGFAQLNAQVTRNFRHWALYIGGENLTDYRQKAPVVGASDPWGSDFDATMVYGPLHGIVLYAGFRYSFGH